MSLWIRFSIIFFLLTSCSLADSQTSAKLLAPMALKCSNDPEDDTSWTDTECDQNNLSIQFYAYEPTPISGWVILVGNIEDDRKQFELYLSDHMYLSENDQDDSGNWLKFVHTIPHNQQGSSPLCSESYKIENYPTFFTSEAYSASVNGTNYSYEDSLLQFQLLCGVDGINLPEGKIAVASVNYTTQQFSELSNFIEITK